MGAALGQYYFLSRPIIWVTVWTRIWNAGNSLMTQHWNFVLVSKILALPVTTYPRTLILNWCLPSAAWVLPSITVGARAVGLSKETKCLDVWLDESLTKKKQAAETSRKVFGFLKNLSYLLNFIKVRFIVPRTQKSSKSGHRSRFGFPKFSFKILTP